MTAYRVIEDQFFHLQVRVNQDVFEIGPIVFFPLVAVAPKLELQ